MRSRPEADAREAELVRMARRGDLEAFNQLVLKYQDLVYNLAYAMLDERAAAEDAAQETFISAFQHMSGFRGGSLRCWLLRITANTCRDLLRARRRHPTVALFPDDEDGNESDSPPWIADPHPAAPAQLESDELSRAVYRWLGELPTPFRSVIVLVDVNGVDYAEAARALGVPIGTVRSRLARARLRMKERLMEEAGFALGTGLTGKGARVKLSVGAPTITSGRAAAGSGTTPVA